MSSSIGMMTSPIYGKIKVMFQTTNQILTGALNQLRAAPCRTTPVTRHSLWSHWNCWLWDPIPAGWSEWINGGWWSEGESSWKSTETSLVLEHHQTPLGFPEIGIPGYRNTPGIIIHFWDSPWKFTIQWWRGTPILGTLHLMMVWILWGISLSVLGLILLGGEHLVQASRSWCEGKMSSDPLPT